LKGKNQNQICAFFKKARCLYSMQPDVSALQVRLKSNASLLGGDFEIEKLKGFCALLQSTRRSGRTLKNGMHFQAYNHECCCLRIEMSVCKCFG